MKKLQSFSKSYFTNLLVFQLFADLLHALKASTDEALKAFIESVLKNFETAFNKYDQTLIASKTAEAPLAFDEKRDWGIRELYAIASVYEDHFLDESKQAAAQFFLSIFKRYGTGSQLSLLAQDEESASLTNILQEMNEERAKTYAAALDVEKLLAYITENNTAFIDARRAVTEENMQLAGQVKNARVEIEKAWDTLRAAINGYAAVKGDDPATASLLDSLNATIEHHKSNVRRAQNAKSDKGETTSDATNVATK